MSSQSPITKAKNSIYTLIDQREKENNLSIYIGKVYDTKNIFDEGFVTILNYSTNQLEDLDITNQNNSNLILTPQGQNVTALKDKIVIDNTQLNNEFVFINYKGNTFPIQRIQIPVINVLNTPPIVQASTQIPAPAPTYPIKDNENVAKTNKLIVNNQIDSEKLYFVINSLIQLINSISGITNSNMALLKTALQGAPLLVNVPTAQQIEKDSFKRNRLKKKCIIFAT